MYLKQQKDGVIIDCALCKSTNIHFESQKFHEVATPNIGSPMTFSTVYRSEYTCNDCGAKCENKQEWKQPIKEE